MADAATSHVARARQLLAAAQRATEAYGRADLTDRLLRSADRLGQPDLPALVIGEFKKGKSTLVNALLNVAVCPVSDELATVVPTVVRHGAEAAAEVVTESQGAGTESDGPPTAVARQPIALEEVATWASERGNVDNVRSIRAVEIRLPRQLLATGLTLIDTPGVGGLHSVHGAAAMAALGTAEVVVFVTDSSQELSGLEIEVLRAAAARCPAAVCVQTKTDLYPAWREIAQLNRQHLDRVGLGQVPVLPVSSMLRQEALARNSKELNNESGYPPLLRFLNDSVIGRSQQTAVRAAATSALFAVEQLESTFQAERAVLADPARTQPVVDELERAKSRAEQLRARSARWQQTLGDGSQDLASEIEHDLRLRLRQVGAAADEIFDERDPMDIWDDFSPWFRREVAAHVADNAELLRHEASNLAARVAEHFALDEAVVAHAIDVGGPPRIGLALDTEFERSARGSGMLAAMRGSYGGILMFGMIGQVAGLTLLNPLTAVVGLGLGRRALREERKRQLTMRKQQAKQATRRYLDEVSFAIGKETRDAIRRVQRELRDEFTTRAEELQRSTREALAAAESAARQTVEQARNRINQIDKELASLAAVRKAAEGLLAATGEGAAA